MLSQYSGRQTWGFCSWKENKQNILSSIRIYKICLKKGCNKERVLQYKNCITELVFQCHYWNKCWCQHIHNKILCSAYKCPTFCLIITTIELIVLYIWDTTFWDPSPFTYFEDYWRGIYTKYAYIYIYLHCMLQKIWASIYERSYTPTFSGKEKKKEIFDCNCLQILTKTSDT